MLHDGEPEPVPPDPGSAPVDPVETLEEPGEVLGDATSVSSPLPGHGPLHALHLERDRPRLRVLDRIVEQATERGRALAIGKGVNADTGLDRDLEPAACGGP